MILSLPYGNSKKPLDLRGLRVSQLVPSAPRATRDLEGLVLEALEKPLAGIPLSELCRNRQKITLVVPDGTRKVELPRILPVVLGLIFRANPEAEVSILVACGTHPPPTGEEIEALLGELPPRVAVFNHNARDAASLTVVGFLGRTAIRINRRAADAEVLITIGAVKHHYFAGFGGGPKMIFPGVAGYDEIQENHALVLEKEDQTWRRNPRCEPGILDANPVAMQIMEAADMRKPDIGLCLVSGAGRQIGWAGAGPWRESYMAAVEVARSWYETSRSAYRFLIATAGGAPYDSTLIQAHKALDAGARFLEDGGELLFIASIDKGAGALEMQPFLDDPSPSTILRSLGKNWIQYGHTTLRIVEKTSRYKVYLHSRLDPDLSRRLGFHPVADPAAIIEKWRKNEVRQTVGVMTGAAVYPRQIPGGRDDPAS